MKCVIKLMPARNVRKKIHAIKLEDSTIDSWFRKEHTFIQVFLKE